MSYISNYPNKLSLSSRHHRRRYRRRCRRRCHHHRYRHRHRCRRLRSLKPRVQVIPTIGHARVLLLRSHVHPHILRSSRHRSPTPPLGSSRHRSSTPLCNTGRHASGRPRHYSGRRASGRPRHPGHYAIGSTHASCLRSLTPTPVGCSHHQQRNCHHQIPVPCTDSPVFTAAATLPPPPKFTKICRVAAAAAARLLPPPKFIRTCHVTEAAAAYCRHHRKLSKLVMLLRQ